MKRILVLCTAAVLSLTPRLLSAQTSGAWTPTDSMQIGRTGHCAVVLPDGDVLVTGGAHNLEYQSSCERYTAATARWNSAPAMAQTRYFHTATLLRNGTVLVIGGIGKNGPNKVCEVFDPARSRWHQTGWLNQPRYSHTATELPGGQLLVSGGISGTEILRGTELYDVSSSEWSKAKPMKLPRSAHSATLLRNGLILIAGGDTRLEDSNAVTATCELFDPMTGQWRSTTSMLEARSSHVAIPLNDGRVLVIGGSAGRLGELRSCEIYDPKSESWTRTGAITIERAGLAATLLPNGSVLAVGGYNSFGGRSYFSMCEIFDPATGQWRLSQPISSPATTPTLSVLRDGRVLVSGGFNMEDYPEYHYRSDCELFTLSQGMSSVHTEAVAGAFVLLGAFPNPAAGRGSIRYSLPSTQRITIALYDEHGQQVLAIADEVQSAGAHSEPFDADALPSGTYFVRALCGGTQQTTPLVIQH